MIEHEAIIRPSVFLGLLVVLAAMEWFFPLAPRKCRRWRQWSVNLMMIAIGSLLLKVLFPLVAVGAASYAADHSLGLLNSVSLPSLLAIILSLLLLDLLLYGQHVVMHKLPFLWRFHRVHHTEIGLDVSTAVRFHPIEIIISMLIKMLFVVLIGAPVISVIIFEVLLNGLALFNHSNIKLPLWADRTFRLLIVTPQVHWIHHSQKHEETNSNFGFNLIIWDKFFRTYKDKSELDYPVLKQGISEVGLMKPLNLYELLVLPFKR